MSQVIAKLFISICFQFSEDDKENVTPPHIETTPEGMATDDKDWLERKQKEDLEKEELEFQRALQMSLQEQVSTGVMIRSRGHDRVMGSR